MAVGRQSGEGTRLWRASLDSLDNAVPFAPSSRFDGLPSYSPDGAQVAFVSSRSGQPEVWLASPDGTGARMLTQEAYAVSTPRWRPNGGYLVFGAALPSRYAIYTASVSNGQKSRVTPSSQDAAEPSWSADGETVYYWVNNELWQIGWDGSQPAKLGTHPLAVSSQSFEDEFYLVNRDETRTLSRLDMRAQAKELVASDLQLRSFALTRRFAYFIKAPTWELHAAPLAGGPSRAIGWLSVAPHFSRGLAVSPDDKEIIWGEEAPTQVDLLLVRDLPR